MNVQQFVRAFESHGLKLVVFLDGGVDAAKLAEWQSRRAKELQKVERVVNHLQKGEEPPSSVWMPPPNISKAVGGCFSQHGVAVYYTAGEADRELASYCVSNSCAAVLAKDSDFFVLPVCAYLNLDTLHLHASPPTVTVYRRQAVEAALSLASPLIPLMGSLVGNDFVPQHVLSDWHRSVLQGRHASGSPLIEAVSQRVQEAAAAAGWTGPWPMSPMMWCALDWSRLLSRDTRALIERSLEQYAVSDEGFSELPISLLERASGASSAMLRRFRRGRLDSAVFTSATRHAIWRGPSIDDPEAAPTILSSRPIRCETYAACLMQPRVVEANSQAFASVPATATSGDSSDGDVPSASAGNKPDGTPPIHPNGNGRAAPAEGSETVHGAGRRTGLASVSEHIIYSAQAQAGAAEAVEVPSQLASCETMWKMQPIARCACLLRAMSRACRADTTVASLDAASVLALGPLALILLGVRFTRRHRLVSRTVALVMLAQGLVMAWLAETRQRLPSELRRRPRAQRRPSIQAAHYASLFTRVSADISILNSACGEPLALHGPWQWFDGVVFEGMLAAASSAGAAAQAAHGADSCWASLLRGDEKLLRVFEELRPVALAIETEHHTKGAQQVEGVPADSSAVGAPMPLPAEIARNAAAAWAVALGR